MASEEPMEMKSIESEQDGQVADQSLSCSCAIRFTFSN